MYKDQVGSQSDVHLVGPSSCYLVDDVATAYSQGPKSNLQDSRSKLDDTLT
jgi:hypothetical protein